MALIPSEILTASQNGDLKAIKEFISSYPFSSGKIRQLNLYDLLLSACLNGHLEIMKCLFEIPQLKQTASKPAFIKDLLTTASRKGYLDIVQYLFNDPQLLSHPQEDLVFVTARFAASKGHTKIVTYMIDNFPNDKELQIALKWGKLFNIACENDQLDTVKYFIANKNVNELNDLHFDYDNAFRLAAKTPKQEVIKYFIFELNIEKTQAIEEYFTATKDANKELIKGWFRVRELQDSLANELDDSKLVHKKVKI